MGTEQGEVEKKKKMKRDVLFFFPTPAGAKKKEKMPTKKRADNGKVRATFSKHENTLSLVLNDRARIHLLN